MWASSWPDGFMSRELINLLRLAILQRPKSLWDGHTGKV